MSDTTEKETKKSKLTLGSSKLKLGDIKSGQVPQSLSHGRVRSVDVRVIKKRRASAAQDSKVSQDKDSQAEANADSSVSDGLSNNERDKRLEILKKASEDKKRADEARKEAEENALKEAQEAERLKKEKEKNEKSKESSDLVKPIKNNERISNQPPSKENKSKKADLEEKERPVKTYKDEPKRRSNKLTIAQALSGGGEEERVRSLASVRRAREKAKRANESGVAKEKEKVIRDVIIPEVITVQELSNRMAERVYDVTKSLMKLGMMVTANQTIDADTAQLVVEEFGHKVKRVADADVEDILEEEENVENAGSRAPVVTFMGHVDHGKTSLLDAIRKAKVADGEAGGITQHIGAYQVQVNEDHKITFLDTPGHEAFTAMRKRGANATDVVVLVVAADDGIMAQTVEAINHAKAAQVPIIVAINKIDKPDANPQTVRNALLEHELVTEELGGEVLAVEVSAKEGTNLDKLLDSILLQAEILELKADPTCKAKGIVVESSVNKKKGVTSTLLVQRGTLKIGDLVVAGEAVGRVRAMKSAEGRAMKESGPSVPVEVMGLDEAPEAGVIFNVVETEKQAREIQEYRQKRSRDLRTTVKQQGTLEDMFLQSREGGKKELPILIKGDVQGSVEAIIGSLEKLATDEVASKVLHSAVGGITTSDIILAGASGAIILGFNVRADAAAKELAAQDNVEIRYYSIIYDLIDDVKSMLSGMLSPLMKEKYLGVAEIRDVFNITKFGKVAGCFVTEGMIKRGAGVRLLRDNVVIHEGSLKTLKRFKDDVKEVGNNFECGMAFENYDDIKVGDVIEAFELIEEKRSL